MTRRQILFGIVTVLAVGAVPAAHSSYRIIGTVTKVAPNRISVKQTKDNRVISIDLTPTTVISRDATPASTTLLKIGTSVVVDALGDSLQFLVATEIRIVPAAVKK